MKAIVLCILCTLAVTLSHGQIFGKYIIEEVNVSPPQFVGIVTDANTSGNASMVAFNQYMSGEIRYPQPAIDRRMQGTEVIQFVVNENGELMDFNVVSSVSELMDEVVIEALRSTNGKWNPGTNNDENVAMVKQVTVIFALSHRQDNIVVNEFKETARILFNKGNRKFLVKGHPKRALRFYDAALNYLPNDQSLLLMRGLCQFQLGNIEQAEEDWSRLKELDGVDESIYQLVDI